VNLRTDAISNHILRQNQIIIVASYIYIYTSVVKLLERRLVLCSSTYNSAVICYIYTSVVSETNKQCVFVWHHHTVLKLPR